MVSFLDSMLFSCNRITIIKLINISLSFPILGFDLGPFNIKEKTVFHHKLFTCSQSIKVEWKSQSFGFILYPNYSTLLEARTLLKILQTLKTITFRANLSLIYIPCVPHPKLTFKEIKINNLANFPYLSECRRQPGILRQQYRTLTFNMQCILHF